MTPKKPAPKAYSYTRFSTPEQAEGDSLRRQADMAARYASQHGLVLDDKLAFHDAGKSAFRGSNAKGGALALFLRAVEDGDVPAGSVLLIETADRLSRLPMRKALRILESIIESEVDVVFLDEGKRYDRAALDGMDLLMFMLKAFRGHEESATKSRRLKSAWVGKRERAVNGELLTHHMPAWLEARDGKPVLIKERAAIVRRVFKLALDGHGQVSIARMLNEEGVLTWGSVGHEPALYWRKTYIRKILCNPAVIGVLTPRVEQHDAEGVLTMVDQAPIEGYYPAVIDKATWRRVRALLNTTGRARGPVQNILAGLAKCPDCGGNMERVNKGASSGGIPKLVCSWAKHGGDCKGVGVKLPMVEAALTGWSFTPPHPDADLADSIRVVDASLEELAFRIQNVTDAIADRPSVALSAKLAKLETERDSLLKVFAELNAKSSETDSAMVKRRGERLNMALAAKPLDIPAANVAMRECFSKVVVNWHDGTLALHWRHDGETRMYYDPSREFEEFEDLDVPAARAKPKAKVKTRRAKPRGKK